MNWRRAFVSRDGGVRVVWRLAVFAGLYYALLVVLSPFAGAAVALMREAGTVEPVHAGVFWSGVLRIAAALLAGRATIALLEPGGRELGFGWTERTPRELLLGLAIGGGALALATGVLVAAGWIGYRSEPGTPVGYAAGLMLALLVLSAPAAAEEALYRGYPFQATVGAIGPVAATLGFSAYFAWAHRHNPAVDGFALANIFLAGVLLAAAYLWTRSLWFATAVHLGWNWAMAGALDLPVSGLALFDLPLYEPVERGPDWATGGSFGPEGGLGGTLGVLLALAAVWWVRDRRRAGDGQPAGHPGIERERGTHT